MRLFIGEPAWRIGKEKQRRVSSSARSTSMEITKMPLDSPEDFLEEVSSLGC